MNNQNISNDTYVIGTQLFSICKKTLTEYSFKLVESSDYIFEADEGFFNSYQNCLVTANKKPLEQDGAHSISRSIFFMEFISKVLDHICKPTCFFSNFKKASELCDSFEAVAKQHLETSGTVEFDDELLVDHVATLSQNRLAPVLAAESESNENLNLKDLRKLLFFNAPRKIYLAHIGGRDIEAAKEAISDTLDKASAGGILNHWSEMVFILCSERKGKPVKFYVGEYNQLRNNPGLNVFELAEKIEQK